MPELPRGTVTFLFTDVEGSTRLWESDRAAMKAAVARHLDLLRDAVEAHRGGLYKTVGDGAQAAFPTATDALAAALDFQRAVLAEPWSDATGPLRVRMALHAGEAEPRAGDYLAAPLNRLSRLLSSGHGGQILLSQAVHELARGGLPPDISLRDLGEYRLRDLLEPEHVFQLLHPDLPGEFPVLKTLAERPNNLPVQPTPFLGREREVAQVTEVVRRGDVRLVTLTGPGGTGKTRLGLQAAAELLDDFPDGVFFVDLAPLADPALVPSALATAFGVRETGGRPLVEMLGGFLRDKHLLLELDNFEHVLEAAPLVSELLRDCPRLKVLATSRAPLRLRGEHEVPVPPLGLPDPARREPPERLAQYEAVRLFIERAQDVSPDFTLSDANAPTAVAICRRLDGLPLAIELAATRVKLLPLEALLNRLEHTLPLLTGGPRDAPARQRTLRDTIDWSHDLLSADEQTLFRRLAAFTGGCTLEAAEEVASREGDLDVFAGLAALVDESLLRRTEGPDGEPRFAMLGTLREFAREQLAASGEEAEACQRHAAFYLWLAEGADAALRGSEQLRWLARLEAEHDNLRAALAWALADPDRGETALRLASNLHWFWYLHGHWSEGRRWLEGALGLPAAACRDGMRARALAGSGILAFPQSDYAMARARLTEAIAISRDIGDRAATAYSLHFLGMTELLAGDYREGRALFEESVALFREAGDRWGLATALCSLGITAVQLNDAAAAPLLAESLELARELGDTWGLARAMHYSGEVARASGDDERARSLYEESMVLYRQLGQRNTAASVGHNLGYVAQQQGDLRRAAALFAEGVAVHAEHGDRRNIGHCLGGLAGIVGLLGNPTAAARLFGAAQTLFQQTGASIWPVDRAEYERNLAAVGDRMAAAAAAAAQEAGRALPLEQAVAEALALADELAADSGA